MLGPVGGSRGHRWALGLCIALAVGLMALQVVATRANATRAVGFSFEDDGPGLRVVEVVAGGPAERAGLQVGDRILRLGEAGLEYGLDYDRVARGFRPGEVVRFGLLRGTRPLTIDVAPGRPAKWVPVLANVMLVMACLVLAVVAARRLEDLRARLLSWLLVSVALILALPWDTIGSVPVALIEQCVYRILVGAQMGIVLHLASVIPGRRAWLRRWPRLGIAFHALGWALGLAAAITYTIELLGDPHWFPIAALHPDVLLLDIAMPLWALAATVALASHAIRGKTATGRAQAALILLGLVPWTIQIGFVTATEVFGAPSIAVGPLYEIGVLLFAVATMVAIFRYHLFDITWVVRRSLVYTSASALMVALLYGVVLVGGSFASRSFASRRWGPDLAVGWPTLAVVFMLGLAFGPLRRLLQSTIDRQVFPRQSALRRQLSDLARELPTLGKLPAMGRRLTSEVRRMFASNNASLLLADAQTGLLTTLVSKNTARTETTAVPMFMPPRDTALRRLTSESRPRLVSELGPLSDDLAARLDKLKAELLVPLISHEALVGVLVLGTRTEGPYAAEEKELLQLLAQHAATVFENVRLYESATYETLTGLLRREAVLELLGREIERARRYRRPLTIALVDIDHFKRVNDAYGHQAGDKVLQAVADELSRGLRSTDSVGRYGGEEFLIILPETSIDRSAIVAEDIRRRVAAMQVPTNHPARPVEVQVSIGLASFDEVADIAEKPADAIVACADRALYRAKNAGRNRVESEVLDPDLVRRVREEAALRKTGSKRSS